MPRPSPKLVGFIAVSTFISTSLASAQTPASSDSTQTDATVEQSPAAAQTPAPSPHRATKSAPATTTHGKMKPAPAATPVHAGFGSMMPGVHTQASPAPTRSPKTKKTVAEKAASPAPKKTAAAAAPVKQGTPFGPSVIAATQSGAPAHATPSPVRQTAPLGDPASVRTTQPTVTTGEIVVPAATPAPPAEGPTNVPVKQRAPVPIATPPPADQPPAPAVAATAPAAVGPPPVQQTAPKTQANLSAQVWVNSESHVYHRQGARYYGKTRKGKYMTEQEAIAEGNRPAREWTPPTGKGGQ